MSNALIMPTKAGTSGSSGVSGLAAGAVLPLYDPRRVHAERYRFRRDAFPELDRANCFYETAGLLPCAGWVLLRRSDYNLLDTYRTDLQLVIQDVQNTRTSVTLKNLAVVQARCVTRGVTADPNAIYLVQLTDQKGLIYNPWFQFPTTSQYNVRAPAYPETFYAASLNAGSPWTWNTMVQDLWNQLSAFLGTYPGLPSSPAGTPEGWVFTGVSCWKALCDVLDTIGMTVAVDLTSATPYSIVNPGAADAAFTALQNTFTSSPNLLEEDFEWLDTGSGRVPAFVVVYFHRRNQYYGTEETVRNDALQWQSGPLYSVTVSAPASFSKAKGTAYLWSDFTVRADIDGNALAADVATANSIAQDRATDYFQTVYRSTLGFMRQTYIGVLPFLTGSMVDGVRWCEGAWIDMFTKKERFGWKTEIVRGYQWPEVEFPKSVFTLQRPRHAGR